VFWLPHVIVPKHTADTSPMPARECMRMAAMRTARDSALLYNADNARRRR
jgi:hypothetical protein